MLRFLPAFITMLSFDLGKNRKRLLLTMAAIAWGTLSILLLLAFGEGLKRQMIIAGKGLGVNIVILYGGQSSIVYEGLPKGRPIRFRAEDAELLRRQIPEISAISPEYDNWGVSFTYGKKTLTERFTGVSPAFLGMRSHIPAAKGRFINQADIDQRRRVVFLGAELKQRLFGERQAVGEQLIISGIPFVVVGVMIEKLQMSMYGGPDANKATIPYTTSIALFGHRYVDRIVYSVDDLAEAAYVEKRVWQVLGQKYKFSPADREAIYTWNVIEQNKAMASMLLGIQIFMGLIGALTLLIASVGVANTMFVTVKERTREIGVKRAIGARRVHIMAQFMLEAASVSALGGLSGALVAYGIVVVLGQVPLAEGPLQFLGKPTFSADIALATSIILLLTSLFAGLLPARKAARVTPVEALRYE
jgi:putative ABC transport system permease protein